MSDNIIVRAVAADELEAIANCAVETWRKAQDEVRNGTPESVAAQIKEAASLMYAANKAFAVAYGGNPAKVLADAEARRTRDTFDRVTKKAAP